MKKKSDMIGDVLGQIIFVKLTIFGTELIYELESKKEKETNGEKGGMATRHNEFDIEQKIFKFL